MAERVRLTIILDVDVAKMGDEYGEVYDRRQAREHIRSDVREFLVSTPYADALTDVDVS